MVSRLAGEGEPTPMRGSGEAIALLNRVLLGLLLEGLTLYNLIHSWEGLGAGGQGDDRG